MNKSDAAQQNVCERCFAVYEKLTKTLIEKNLRISTMESCTSGCIASLITDTEGASAVMKGGLVTYSNEAKEICGVPATIIDTYGVYSRETASAMAMTVRNFYDTDIAVGVTGSLGRVDPSNADSVPGQVYFAIDYREEIRLFFLDDVFGKNRRESKLIIAERVAGELLQILLQ